jgi:hypothetical protein
VTIPWIRLIPAAGLLLFLVFISAAAAVCPGDCVCLGASQAASEGYTTLCGGKQIICGYEQTLKAQIPKYCYENPVVTTTTPTIVKCPSGCTCLAAADAQAKGYSSCPQEKRPCGYDNQQNLKYCFAVPVVTTTTPVPSGKPDLVINDVYTEAWPSFRVFRYIIQNRGDGAAGPSTTRLIIDGVQVGEDAVASLNPGESRVEEFSYSGTCSGSSDLFGAVADIGGVFLPGCNNRTGPRAAGYLARGGEQFYVQHPCLHAP